MDPFHYPLASGLNATRLALGCMQFAGSWEPEAAIPAAARTQARAALETALDLGWNVFDHADIYCRGRSELLFGELLRESGAARETVILQSKCGIRFPDEPRPGDPHRFDFSRAHILASVDASLQRLGTEYLDILLLHRPDLLAEPEEVIAAFDELRAAGKVRHFGVSNFPPPLLELFRAEGFIPVANQVELNLLRTSLLDSSVVSTERQPSAGYPADGTLEWHRIHGVVTQAWAPMAYGHLSGRALEKDPGGHVAKAAAVAADIAAAHGAPAEAVVIAWLLRHPAGIQPIIGTRDPQRLRACHRALELRLSREEWYALYLAGRGKALP